jgi:hypothetical protein
MTVIFTMAYLGDLHHLADTLRGVSAQDRAGEKMITKITREGGLL